MTNRVAGFITMTTDYRWAWGETKADSRKKVRGLGGTLKDSETMSLPTGALNAQVDQMGCIRWDWAEGANHDEPALVA